MEFFVSIGGNAPHSCSLLRDLMERMEQEYEVTGMSDIYTTAANDGVSPDYYNAVVRLESVLTPSQLQAEFKAIEHQLGRTPADKSVGIIPVDIDIVVADGKVIRPRDFDAAYFRIGFEHIVEACD